MLTRKDETHRVAHTVGELREAIKDFDGDTPIDGGFDGPIEVALWVRESGENVCCIAEE
jgi:hypothetical protein